MGVFFLGAAIGIIFGGVFIVILDKRASKRDDSVQSSDSNPPKLYTGDNGVLVWNYEKGSEEEKEELEDLVMGL